MDTCRISNGGLRQIQKVLHIKNFRWCNLKNYIDGSKSSSTDNKDTDVKDAYTVWKKLFYEIWDVK